jgi:hypothetical protein
MKWYYWLGAAIGVAWLLSSKSTPAAPVGANMGFAPPQAPLYMGFAPPQAPLYMGFAPPQAPLYDPKMDPATWGA